MAIPILGPKPQFFDANGDPLSGGKFYSYEAGTLTPKDTYTTSAGNVANTNPVILDSAGQANIWLGDGDYKFALYDADDVLLWTVDNYAGETTTAFGGQVFEISSSDNLGISYQNSVIIATNTISLSLPPVADAGEGFLLTVYNYGSGVVTLDPDGSETINGTSSLLLYPGEGALVITDGEEWWGIFKQRNSSVSTKTISYAVTVSDRDSLINCNATGGAITVTIPSAASLGSGFQFSVKKTDSTINSVTIDPNSTETIDGQLTLVLAAQYDEVTLISDGTNWFKLSQDNPAITATKTTTYTVLPTDNFVPCDATSGTFTVTLFSPAANVGKEVTIEKIDSTFTIVTISAPSGTINGSATVNLSTQYESITIVSNGTNFYIKDRRIPSTWSSYTPSTTQGLGTVSNVNLYRRRVGDSMEIRGRLQAGTVTATEARVSFIASGETLTSTSAITTLECVGVIIRSLGTSAASSLIEPSVSYMTVGGLSGGVATLAKQNGSAQFANSDVISIKAMIPISGWEG
jgi:hypothetical protein